MEPVIIAGAGPTGMPSVRNPITPPYATPLLYDLAPPTLGD